MPPKRIIFVYSFGIVEPPILRLYSISRACCTADPNLAQMSSFDERCAFVCRLPEAVWLPDEVFQPSVRPLEFTSTHRITLLDIMPALVLMSQNID
jgi:hypothetical protein